MTPSSLLYSYVSEQFAISIVKAEGGAPFFSPKLSTWLEHYTAKHFRRLFLGAFEKLRKATISFVMSLCLSVRQSVRMEKNRRPLDGF